MQNYKLTVQQNIVLDWDPTIKYLKVTPSFCRRLDFSVLAGNERVIKCIFSCHASLTIIVASQASGIILVQGKFYRKDGIPSTVGIPSENCMS